MVMAMQLAWLPPASRASTQSVARPFSAARGCQYKTLGRARLQAVCAMKARWCIDIKYGVKMEALALVQEWVRDIGSSAGLNSSNARLSSGAVGVPESRLELEVEFDSLAEVEAFWAAIPPAEHRAWSQRAQNFIIDGSPRWELFRTCPVLAEESSSIATQAVAPKFLDRSRVLEAPKDYMRNADKDQRPQNDMGTKRLRAAENDLPAGVRIATDWKGDPMYINPGDQMPLF